MGVVGVLLTDGSSEWEPLTFLLVVDRLPPLLLQLQLRLRLLLLKLLHQLTQRLFLRR